MSQLFVSGGRSIRVSASTSLSTEKIPEPSREARVAPSVTWLHPLLHSSSTWYDAQGWLLSTKSPSPGFSNPLTKSS